MPKRRKLQCTGSSCPPGPLGTRTLIPCVFSLLLLAAAIRAFRCCFLCFIASTSGLKALHLTESVTPRYAFAPLLHSALHFLHLFSLCVPAPPSAVLLVNYLLYFVSELMSDIKRRTALDSEIQKMASSLLSWTIIMICQLSPDYSRGIVV